MMQTTTHNSRANAAGRVHGTKHNDRDFNLTTADNIDAERTPLNTRRGWHYVDKSDVMCIGQEKALIAAGMGCQPLKKQKENAITVK